MSIELAEMTRERDALRQRVGALEGLLRESTKFIKGGGYEATRHAEEHKLGNRIRDALNAPDRREGGE